MLSVFVADGEIFLYTEYSFKTHILGDLNGIGTPWSDHLAARTDEETLHAVTIIACSLTKEPFQLIDFVVIK